MILRFRGRQGTFRVSAEPSLTFAECVQKLSDQLPPGELKISSAQNQRPTGRDAMWDKTLEELGIKHGEMLFFELEAAKDQDPTTKPERLSDNPNQRQQLQHEVDNVLSKMDGKIPRPRSKLCRHDDRGMCEYCIPLEPFDEQYRVDHGIKHLSLWAEVRKSKELVQPFFGVKKCSRHPPFPASICSACQPQPISLQQQKFRVVDHVEFASSTIINNFVDYWRQTNTQRAGYLIGKYELYDVVPLGCKAVVHAIWEPQQSSALDGVEISEGNIPRHVELAARALDLEVVGIIWSDVVDAGAGDGSVVCKRHANSYFMSSQEVLLSASLQCKFPNVCSAARDKVFSSKFVTCIVSGNTQNQIDVACYQMSAAAEALVGSSLVEASVNPSIVRVKKRTSTIYVPEVFYKIIDQYGNTVQKSGKPSFPTDYLLVSLSHGFSETDATVISEFPIENRPQIMGQTPSKLVDQLELLGGFNSDKMVDFHLLAYLFSMEILSAEEQQLLCDLLRLERSKGDSSAIIDTATKLAYSDGFGTLRMLGA